MAVPLKNINKYLDICLKCGKCSNFCPSDINIVEVILAAKAEYFQKSLEGKILSIIQSKLIFNTLLNIIKFLFGKQKKFPKKYTQKAIYFGGCIEKFNPKTSEYIKQLLNNMNIEVVDKSFDCCGLPFLTSGNLKRFSQQAKENIKKIVDTEFDYFVTDCASCQWAWKEYINYIDNAELKSKLENIKFISIYELIFQKGLEFESKEFFTTTYHNPCHEDCENVENIIKNIHNTEYKELENKTDCCGFSGLIKPTTWKISKKITKKKKKNILQTNSDFIITSCVGCLINLSIILGFNKKVIRLIDFLRKNCVIKKKNI